MLVFTPFRQPETVFAMPFKRLSAFVKNLTIFYWDCHDLTASNLAFDTVFCFLGCLKTASAVMVYPISALRPAQLFFISATT